jgi:hypothetical protein
VSRNNNEIKGQHLLNLALARPPPAEDELTKNLSLYTTSGAITAEIWITHDGSDQSRRAYLELQSDNGSIFAKVVRFVNPCRAPIIQLTWMQHDPYSSNGERIPRPTLAIELRASYGEVSLSIPRCFRGPITIQSGHGRIAFSPDLERSMALHSDVNGTRVYFVGERPLTGKWRSGEESYEMEREEEPLDELSVGGSHTSVRINWVGEPEVPEMRPNGWDIFCLGAVRFFTTGRVN